MLDPNPSPTDVEDLSDEEGGKTGVSASDVYDYYLYLWNQRDQWWWSTYGNDSDGFTIYDFLSIMAYHEAGFMTSMVTTLAEAGVRFFLEWARTTKNNTNLASLLDWWARFSESTARLINGKLNPTEKTAFSNATSMSYFGNAFMSPPKSWQKGWDFDRPYNWGNKSVLSVDTVKAYHENDHAMFVILDGTNPFYIPSGCAWYNWQENSYYNTVCPSVP